MSKSKGSSRRVNAPEPKRRKVEGSGVFSGSSQIVGRSLNFHDREKLRITAAQSIAATNASKSLDSRSLNQY